jgi:FAD/FMN-containing dehydrogenase
MAVHQAQISHLHHTDALDGKLLTPAHPEFKHARQAWNLAVDQRPAAVVAAESPADVVATLSLARQNGLRVAAQGTGHGAAALGPLEDTILVKTNRLRAIEIDPRRRIARLESGVTWSEAAEAAAQHGLGLLAGSSPDVGVTGYTLGGGLSWLGRKHGLAVNSVHAIELVTADGRVVRADHDHEPELFWALRGGGGSFGVVTAVELRALPITDVYAGLLWWPIERGDEVLHGWGELTQRELPDELTTVGRYLKLPALPEVPEPLRGRSFVVVEVFHLGNRVEADELLAPLRALEPENDTLDVIPVETLGYLHMDPDRPVPFVGDGLLLEQLPAAAVDKLARMAGTGSPLLSVEIRQLGGELVRPAPDGGARSAIDAPYALFALGMAPTADAGHAVGAYVEHLIKGMDPWRAPEMYLNFAESRRDPTTLWGEDAYRRLRQIKARVDPDDLIRSNHPIPPA